MSIMVAVYGTLRKNNANHALLRDSDLVGTFSLDGWVMHSNGCFPYAVPGDGTIVVELYKIDESTLRSLDRLEGYCEDGQGLYDRVSVRVNTGDAYETAMIYTPCSRAVTEVYPRVESGDWMNQ